MSSPEIKLDFRREDVAKATKVIAVAAIIFVVFMLATKSMYTVQPNQEAVVLRFGSYSTTWSP